MPIESEYADLEPLETRIAIHRTYSQQPDDVEEAVYSVIRDRLGDAVLDVGCGTGTFLSRLCGTWEYEGELTGLDSSPAAVEAVNSVGAAAGVLGDATDLPFGAGRFDTVTARHMLYHVADPDNGLREFNRVTRPGGQVAVSVNHADTLPGINGLVCEQLVRHGITPVSLASSIDSSDLPDRMSAAKFTDVKSIRIANALVFPTAEPLIRYAVATLGVYGLEQEAPARPSIEAGIRRAATDWFAKNSGPWRDPKGYSICIGRVKGGH